jgi:hypothetical protein
LKFALVRQLAHREKRNAGRINRKYIGSKYIAQPPLADDMRDAAPHHILPIHAMRNFLAPAVGSGYHPSLEVAWELAPLGF